MDNCFAAINHGLNLKGQTGGMKNLILVLAFCLSAACSPSFSPIEPFSSSGFASGAAPSSLLGQEVTYTLNAVGSKDGAAAVATPEITITPMSDPRHLSIDVDGDVVRMRDSVTTRSGYFEGASANGLLVFQNLGDTSGFSNIAQLTRTLGTSDLHVLAVYGADTDPTAVAARQAQAQYAGEAYLIGRRADGSYQTRTGTMQADVNFGTARVSGDMTLNEVVESSGDFAMRSVRASFDNARINGNGFEADLNVNQTMLNADLPENLTLNGRFFGSNASEIAGTFSGEGTTAGSGGQDVGFSGAFSLSE